MPALPKPQPNARDTASLQHVDSVQHLASVQARVIDWYRANLRDLPWRADARSAWGVLVSEVMLQQTPVVRVLPVWQQWLQRWSTPRDLAEESAAEVLRAWGRLGYPRRALRLQQAAVTIVENFDGEVPGTEAELLSLPGIGTYTAAAVAAFAFGQRAAVVDTNIRRVHARVFSGQALPAPSLTAAETALAHELLPADTAISVQWNIAVMELGALVCTARSPKCGNCPLIDDCAWIAAGEPEPTYTPKGQSWAGTDRQLRGAVMAVLRQADGFVPVQAFTGPTDFAADVELSIALEHVHSLSHAPERVRNAVEGLLKDGLAEADSAGTAFRLPV